MPPYLEICTDIAREAGALLAGYFERGVGFKLKGDFDLVTEADRASEKLIVERLRGAFPSHSIVAEEGGGHESDSGYRWYVDPLDGTTNFAHGFPVFNVTLALEHNGELLCGVVFDPTRQEVFQAEKGAGAFLNGERMRVSHSSLVREALVATGFPSQKRHQNVNVHFYYQLAMLSHGVRRAGSAAIDLAYVACGRLDAFWEFALNPWDVAAGILLVCESGGTCSDMHGAPASVHGPHLLADNTHIHGEMVNLFADIFGGHYAVPMVEMHS